MKNTLILSVCVLILILCFTYLPTDVSAVISMLICITGIILISTHKKKE